MDVNQWTKNGLQIIMVQVDLTQQLVPQILLDIRKLWLLKQKLFQMNFII